METIFFHFLRGSQPLPVEAVFVSTGAYFSVNPLFRLEKMTFLSTGNSIFLFEVFFQLMEIVTEFRGSQILRQTIYPLVDTIFFRFFQIVFKVEFVIPYSENLFFQYPLSD